MPLVEAVITMMNESQTPWTPSFASAAHDGMFDVKVAHHPQAMQSHVTHRRPSISLFGFLLPAHWSPPSIMTHLSLSMHPFRLFWQLCDLYYSVIGRKGFAADFTAAEDACDNLEAAIDGGDTMGVLETPMQRRDPIGSSRPYWISSRPWVSRDDTGTSQQPRTLLSSFRYIRSYRDGTRWKCRASTIVEHFVEISWTMG